MPWSAIPHEETVTPAVVVRTRAFGESDKIVTFLTRDLGKIAGIAKGARRSKRRFVNVLEPFTHVDVTLRVPRSQVRFLRSARIVEDGERPTVVARFEGHGHALRSLLAWGASAEVLAPPELRERIAAAAAETAALYAAV